MPRFKEITPKEADRRTKKSFAAIEKQMGTVPNMFKGMASTPMALEAFLQLEKTIDEGELNPDEREVVRYTASAFNDCRYCKAAAVLTGRRAGMNDEDVQALRNARSEKPRYKALIDLTRHIMDNRGHISDDDISQFRHAGFKDEHVGEVLTIIAQKTLSNFFNHVHQTELDLPEE